MQDRSNNGSYQVPSGQKMKLSFNAYKYSIFLVVISTSTYLATDTATFPLTPGYSHWQCLLVKQKGIATYHCTYLMLQHYQSMQTIYITVIFFFCGHIILLHQIYSLLNISSNKNLFWRNHIKISLKSYQTHNFMILLCDLDMFH